MMRFDPSKELAMIYKNIIDATGHTPLVRLNKLVEPGMAEVLVKFEGLEVGGSIKTRVAAAMIASEKLSACRTAAYTAIASASSPTQPCPRRAMLVLSVLSFSV